MMDMDIFQLLYNHLEERHYNNICQNAKQDANYLKATVLENELNAEYEKLNLSDEQQNVIMQWIMLSMPRKLLIPLLLSEWGCNAVFPC